MASFSFPPARAGRGGGRPQPQRTGSAGSRASPYQRPSSSGSTPSTPTDKWQHDLFGEGSDLYNPSLNSGALKSKLRGWGDDTPSASLRPFGAATPAAQPIRATVQQVQQQAPANGTGRAVPAQGQQQQQFGIKGRSDQAAERRRLQQEKERAQQEQKELRELRQKQEREREREEKAKIAREEDKGTVVQVEGLVSGTSAEDVQTAFGSYGEIRFCFIVNPTAASLIARLTFSKHEDATTACSKLDGAVADGRPLRVKQVTRTPMPEPLPPLPKMLAGGAGAAVPTGPRGVAGAPTGPRGRQASKAATVPAPAPIPSKMYADGVEAAQQSVVGDSMDVDMAPPTSSAAAPTGPRRGRGRGAAVVPAAPLAPGARPGPPPSLAQRVGVTPAATAGRQQQQQQQAVPQSLAARLGVANGAPAAAGGAGKGKKGKAGAAGAVQGNSLLARLG
ncbi:hypothetical protein JCM11251_007356 [Rhodosporidiobolus azoricus]